MDKGVIEVKTQKEANCSFPTALTYIFKELMESDDIQIYIHGSWADESNIFFSDIDDFVIVNDSTQESYNHSMRKLKKSEIKFAHIDPLQHHGHWIVKLSEIKDYDDAFLPHYTLQNSLCISGKEMIPFQLSDEIVEEKIKRYLLFTLYNISLKNRKVKNNRLCTFEIKALVSSYSLLPALVYQSLGFRINKKDAIEKFLNENSKSCEALLWASDVRNRFELIKDELSFKLFSKLPYLFKSFDKWYTFSLKYSPKVKLSFFRSKINYSNFLFEEFSYLCHECIRPNIIKNLAKNECEKTIDQFINSLRQNSNILATYQFGEIKEPGISDLDLLIIVKDGKLKEEYSEIRKAINKKSEFIYLFLHDPIIIEEQNIEEFCKIHTLNNIQLIFSQKDFSRITNEDRNINTKLIYVNWLLFLILYTNEVLEGLVGYDERQIHHLLKNMAVSIDYLNPEVGILEKVKELRKLSLSGNIGKRELDKQMKLFYEQLISLNFSSIKGQNISCNKSKFLVGRNTLFVKSDCLKIEKNKGKTIYWLPDALFEYSYDILINSHSQNVVRNVWLKLYLKYQNCNVPLMTVFPFHHSWIRRKEASFTVRMKYKILDILAYLPITFFRFL